MKRILLATLITLVSFNAFAGTLSNSDSKSYDLEKNQSSGGTVHTSISSNTTQSSTCSSFPCTIKNKTTGDTVTLKSSSENVEIRNGKFIIK